MAMKRRKRKRSSKAANLPKIPSTAETSASPSEISFDSEMVARFPDIPSDSEKVASSPSVSCDAANVAGPSVAPAGADRRTHPRYEFFAAAEVVPAESGARMETRVRDLSQQGCYVDTNDALPLGTITDVRITKGAQPFEARARVVYSRATKGMGLVFTTIEPERLRTLETWLTDSRETSWLAANRRRSQRVLMTIPARVSGQNVLGSPIEEETQTLAISAHGALILVSTQVYRGQRLTLSNVQASGGSGVHSSQSWSGMWLFRRKTGRPVTQMRKST